VNVPCSTHALEIELQAASNRVVFARARRRRPALAMHDSIVSMLMVLRDPSQRGMDDKETLTRAILAEHAHCPHRLWATLLLLACGPMLRRLRRRIQGETLTADDLDQLVVSTFLEVIAAFPLDHRNDRTFMYLRQMTQRRVFEQVRTERRNQEFVRVATAHELRVYEQLDRAWPDMRPPGESDDAEVYDDATQIAFLHARAGDALDTDKLEPVIATMVHGERLRAYVERAHPHVDAEERRRIYQRIKRNHSRLIGRLRMRLASLHEAVTFCRDQL
jgi:hypothetical protein